MLDRRLFLAAGSASALLAGAAPRMAFARAGGDRRFVFILQRGAADGLGTLLPVGDPRFQTVRGPLAEDSQGAAKLDSLFALHPAMEATARMFAAREALFAHAVASPYRDRSHFDGQNILETGGRTAYTVKDGWMNRLLSMLPEEQSKALALSSTVPVILRGANPVTSYAPSALPDASSEFLARVAQMYEGDDQLHRLWSAAMDTRAMAGDEAALLGRNAAAAGSLAARLLSGPDGTRIALIESGGWDTHANQRGRLTAQLRGLDALLAALKSGLGGEWANTLVIVATEFGRTAAPNGTGGTDHGTGSAAILLGGKVAGGRVLTDWPGLAPAALLEGRDLRPTLALDALIATALAQHYDLGSTRLLARLFPDSKESPLRTQLIRT